MTPNGSTETVALVAPALNSYIIFAKGSFSQSTCDSVPTAEIKSKSSSGSTVIVPIRLISAQVPMVVTV